MLVGVLPEVYALPEPFVVFVANLEGFSADQSISRRSISSMIPDYRPVIIRVIENLGRQGQIPKGVVNRPLPNLTTPMIAWIGHQEFWFGEPKP